jgi:hypothetical protein
VESASSSASSSLFLESRHNSWETQATQDSIRTPQKKRSHTIEFESPHSVATPPPETPDSRSSYKVQRTDLPPIPRPNFGTGALPKRQEKGPKESVYQRGPAKFHSPDEHDMFSPASEHFTPKPLPPLERPNPMSPTQLKPSLKTLPPLIDHVISSPSNFVYIAHDDWVQKLIERRQLAWGVQWEIARGITDSLWKWEDVAPEKLDKLKGTNTQAASKVGKIIQGEQISTVTPNVENEHRLWFVRSSPISFALLT